LLAKREEGRGMVEGIIVGVFALAFLVLVVVGLRASRDQDEQK